MIDKPSGRPLSMSCGGSARAGARRGGMAGRSIRWRRRVPDLPRGRDRARAVSARRGQGVRGDDSRSASRPTPSMRRVRRPAARRRGPRRGARSRALRRISGPNPADAAAILGAQAATGGRLRIRARRREGRSGPARWSSTSWCSGPGPPRPRSRCACAARRGPTCGRSRSIWAGRSASARISRRCAAPGRGRSASTRLIRSTRSRRRRSSACPRRWGIYRPSARAATPPAAWNRASGVSWRGAGGHAWPPHQPSAGPVPGPASGRHPAGGCRGARATTRCARSACFIEPHPQGVERV